MSKKTAVLIVVALTLVFVSALPATAQPQFSAYNSLSGADHQRRFDELNRRGFRIISISVHGPANDPRYAAVWVRRAGPRWAAVHGVNAAGFQTAFDTWARRGYKPVLVAATGPSNAPVFAAVFQETTARIPITKHGLTSGSEDDTGSIEHWLKQARDRNLMPSTLAIYGSANDPRFAIVLEPNTENVAWGIGGLNQTASEYQATFNALTSAWNRPGYVAVSPAARYLSLFRDDQIGQWVARHGLTTLEFIGEFTARIAQGFYPIQIQAGGVGLDTRFAALFARSESPLPRAFTSTGPNTSQGVDAVIEDFMKTHAVRQAALAVVQGRRLVYARGFTWAEAGHPITQPTTLFRLGSTSKVLTSIAIHQLIQEGRLLPSQRVQEILQLRTPTGSNPSDPRFANLTVGDLLRMRGWIGRVEEEDVAEAFRQRLPVTSQQIARQMVTQKLSCDPGASCEDPDGNPEFLLLGLLAENLRGQSLLDIVRTRIGGAIGAQRIRLGVAQLNGQPADEARYYDVMLTTLRSDVEPARPLVPEQYGEFDHTAWAGPGGFSVAAVDFAKVLASLNTDLLLNASMRGSLLLNANGWDGSRVINGRIHTWKGGYLTGLQSTVNFRQDGLAYVLYWNRSRLPRDAGWYPEFPRLTGAIAATAWPPGDLFPTFGIPSLP